MALINKTTGYYVRVTSIDVTTGIAFLETWRNKDHRLTGGDEFSKPLVTSFYVGMGILNGECEVAPLVDNLKRLVYLAMKNDPLYSDYEDDL